MNEPEWEFYADSLERIKVDGGYLYAIGVDEYTSLCFVPDIDLTRYQSHLRDAYNTGYKDGKEDAKHSNFPLLSD